MVEKHHSHVTAIVLINHTSASVDKVLDSQARAGSHATIGAMGDMNGQVSLDNALATSRNGCILRTEMQSNA